MAIVNTLDPKKVIQGPAYNGNGITIQQAMDSNGGKLPSTNLPTDGRLGGVNSPTTDPVSKPPLAYSYNKTAPTAYDPTADANSFRDSQTKAAIARLESQRAASLSALGAERTKLANDSNDQRQSTSINSKIAAKNFAEYMAQRGQNNAVGGSGINDYATLLRNMQYQGDLGAINKTETLGNQDIARRQTLAQDLYNSGVTASGNDIDAQITKSLMEAKTQAARDAMTNYYADRTFDYNQYRDSVGDTQFDKNFNRETNQFDKNFNFNVGNALGTINGSKTLAAKGQEFSQNMETKRFDTGNEQFQKEYDLKVEDTKQRNNQWEKQFNSQEQQRKFENDLNLNKFDFDKETVTWNQVFETGKFNFTKAQTAIDNDFRDKQANIDNSYKQGQLSLSERELAHRINNDNKQNELASAKFAYEKKTGGADGKLSEGDKKYLRDAELNKSYGEDYKAIKSLSYDGAIKELTDGADLYIGTYGEDGYAKLWNSVLADAIREGRAQPKNLDDAIYDSR